MKNIDKLRAMTAEELANQIAGIGCKMCFYKQNSPECDSDKCEKGIAKWLNQEANPMPELHGGDIVKTYYGEYVAIGGAVLVNPTTMVRNFLGSLNDTVRFVYRYNGSDKRYETIWSADDE